MADTSSVATSYSPATPIFAGTRSGSPREVDPSLVVDYECESDEMADSGRLEQSPDRHRATDYASLTEKVQSHRRVSRLFGSDDEDDPPSPVQSRKPSSAFIFVRDGDDGVSHRSKSYRGTPVSVGTTQGSTDTKVSTLTSPWMTRSLCLLLDSS